MVVLLHHVVALAFPGLMLYAMYSDVSSLRIANWISIAMAALFMPTALLAGMGWADIGIHYAVGTGVLIVLIAAFALGLLGGGDVKLFSAGAVWFGLSGLMPFAVWVALLGGVLALVTLFIQKGVVYMAPVKTPMWLAKVLERKQAIPYGLAIGIAAIALMPRIEVWPTAWAPVLSWLK